MAKREKKEIKRVDLGESERGRNGARSAITSANTITTKWSYFEKGTNVFTFSIADEI